MLNHSPNRASARPCRRLHTWIGMAGIIGLLAVGCYTKDDPEPAAAAEPEPTTTEPRNLPGDGLTVTPDTSSRVVPQPNSDGVPQAIGDIKNDLGLTEPTPDAGADAGAPSVDGGS
jgi:hypothetical protein